MDVPDTTLSMAELQKQNAALLAENSYLKQELAALRRLIFGGETRAVSEHRCRYTGWT